MIEDDILLQISIHALLAESDFIVTAFPGSADRFLSTLSLRRATENSSNMLCSVEISIHALLAESDRQAQSLKVAPLSISIHALLAESDRQSRKPCHLQKSFLSTLSLRRATEHLSDLMCLCLISIHALLAESDESIQGYFPNRFNFYPRSPCGERPPKLLPSSSTS